MFSNALVNALEFGNEVRVELTVKERVVSVVIDDDGPRIAEADWERVFETFNVIAVPNTVTCQGSGSPWCDTSLKAMAAVHSFDARDTPERASSCGCPPWTMGPQRPS